jgi:hypothetical protein
LNLTAEERQRDDFCSGGFRQHFANAKRLALYRIATARVTINVSNERFDVIGANGLLHAFFVRHRHPARTWSPTVDIGVLPLRRNDNRCILDIE